MLHEKTKAIGLSIFKFFRIVKCTTIILLMTVFQVYAYNGGAQVVTISGKDIPLEKIVSEIKRQTNLHFFYNSAIMRQANRVNIDVKNVPVSEALDISFRNQPRLMYKIIEGTVVISLKSEGSNILNPSGGLSIIEETPSPINIKGKVVDEKGNAVEGVTVTIKGTNQSTFTNSNGEFLMNSIDQDAILVFTAVNVETFELMVSGQTELLVKLKIKVIGLSDVEVVSTGYQDIPKERATGSFVKVNNELFNRQTGTRVMDRIHNVTSGLIFNPKAAPSGGGLVVRGYSTINAGTDPLIVVDNFPYEGSLNTLNPNDVESITVLKDAAAASIWGVRAGNGVIIITTKKGRFNQKNQVGFVANVTISRKPDLFYIPYLPSKDIIEFEGKRFSDGIYNDYDDIYPASNIFPVLPQAVEIMLEARRNGISDPLNDPAVIQKLVALGAYDVRNDIKKYLLRNGVDQQYALNFSGGSNTFNYYASVGYDKNLGQNIEERYDRASVNFTNTYKPFSKLEISTAIVFTRETNNDAGVNYKNFLPDIGISPYTRLADDSGNPLAIPKSYRTAYIDTAQFPRLLDWNYRPLEDYHYISHNRQQSDTRLSAIVRYLFLPGLQAEMQYQRQFTNAKNRIDRDQNSYDVRNGINRAMNFDEFGKLVYPWPLGNVVELTFSEYRAWNLRGTLRFDKIWNNHELNTFGGMELRETSGATHYNYLYGFDPGTNISQPVNETVTYPARPEGLTRIGRVPDPLGSITRHGSAYLNASYSFRKKYQATLSGRMDQSNFFGVKANLRRVPLWSAGIGWNISMEKFYKLNWLPLLKLRSSYGYTGNTNSGATSFTTFRYRSGSEGVPARNIPYGQIMTPGNPNLRWERVKILNVGLDFSFRGNRLSGSIDYYRKNGIDLLGPVLIEPTTGVTSYTGNRASIKGSGIDVILNSININSKTFQWNTSILFNFSRDEVTAFYGDIPIDGVTIATAGALQTGFPLNPVFSFNWAGLDPTNGDPRIYLGDTVSSYNNFADGKKEDLIFHGQYNPKIFGSFLNTIRWKQLSVSANITFRLGHYFRRNSIDYYSLFSSGWSAHNDYRQRWTKPGDELTTNVPSLPTEDNILRNSSYLFSSVLIEKADYIRLQDIRLGYEINGSRFKNKFFKTTTVFMYAANVKLLWRANKHGIDPDAPTFGATPMPLTISFGLNANF